MFGTRRMSRKELIQALQFTADIAIRQSRDIADLLDHVDDADTEITYLRAENKKLTSLLFQVTKND